MKLIALTNGFETKVSDLDYGYLCQWRWQSIIRNEKPIGVCRYVRRRPSKGFSVLISHEILIRRNIKIFCEVDHIDRDPLNNQFDNLRPATTSQNGANRCVQSNNTTGYKGTSYDKRSNKYVAYIKVRGKRIQLGLFLDLEEAAKTYDKAAKFYFGAFANTNFKESSNV